MWKKIFLVFKMHHVTRGVVNFYGAGVVTHDRRIGSWTLDSLQNICYSYGKLLSIFNGVQRNNKTMTDFFAETVAKCGNKVKWSSSAHKGTEIVGSNPAGQYDLSNIVQ
jgi:hypothetical protein